MSTMPIDVLTKNPLQSYNNNDLKHEISDLRYWLLVNKALNPNATFIKVRESKEILLTELLHEARIRGLKF